MRRRDDLGAQRGELRRRHAFSHQTLEIRHRLRELGGRRLHFGVRALRLQLRRRQFRRRRVAGLASRITSRLQFGQRTLLRLESIRQQREVAADDVEIGLGGDEPIGDGARLGLDGLGRLRARR